MATERFSQVLVVEDSEAELRLLCEILEDEGFEVIGCGSAAEGLDQIKRRDFGVAVVDLRLPDLSGTQLLERIRGLDNQVRVIIYTGVASYDSIKEALNLGAFAYMEKLSDPSELLRHVHRACRERVSHYAIGLEAAVAERTADLARSNRELADFASVVAHDLRSPLLTISGYCQILQEELHRGSCDDTREHLGKIVDAVLRMNRLIEDLLDYSRVGRSDEPFQSIALDAVVAHAMANLERAITESRARIDVGPMPTVTGDSTQLVQLFQNLMGNAIKFHAEADPVIRLRAGRHEGDWQFSVEDNGIGIDSSQFEHIFQVFQRLHGKEYPGTGVGLAVCKKIVERHRGRIWLESQPGRGTTFFFTLPAKAPPPA
jgi:signal transduction histidine kinase